jgi:hypothetical protein
MITEKLETALLEAIKANVVTSWQTYTASDETERAYPAIYTVCTEVSYIQETQGDIEGKITVGITSHCKDTSKAEHNRTCLAVETYLRQATLLDDVNAADIVSVSSILLSKHVSLVQDGKRIALYELDIISASVLLP